MNTTINNTLTDRHTLLQQLKNTAKTWDMVVIGGGITGAGIVREATRLGLRVLLVEQKDFAWGTSSRSSKMVHGGLRYLGMGDYKTTMHSVRERERLLTETKGLVNQQAYIMAHYKGKFPPPFIFNILLWLYDFFAGKRYRYYHHKQKFITMSPHIKQQGLKGATEFADAVTDDARLVLRVLHEAVAQGAEVLNYTQATDLVKNTDGYVTGVVVQDGLSHEKITIHAKVVVNATGAWVDKLRQQADSTQKPMIRPARGSHIVVSQERLRVDYAYTLMHPQDNRALFIFPWENRTVIGTTDLDHPPLNDDEVGITQAEQDYLLAAVADLFPQAKVQADDVISSWAGVRPLIASGTLDPSKEKRNHSIWLDKGLISVSGGKLTTFRLIALDVLQKAAPMLGTSVQETKAAMFGKVSPPQHPAFARLSEMQQQRLLGFYGNGVDSVLSLASAEVDLTPIADTNTLWVELKYVTRYEAVQHLDDILLRRTRLGLLLPQGAMGYVDDIKAICQTYLGWSDQQWQQEQDRYQHIWQQYYALPMQHY